VTGPSLVGDGGDRRRSPLRTGVIVPSFRPTPDEALAVAAAAEAAGVDGVFCFDHLWPLSHPERPALAPFPLLGAVAARTEAVCVGTLMARVGLVPDEVLLAEFLALEALAPRRVVAGLGTGDRMSAAENLAYGVAYGPAAERRAALVRCARTLIGWGVPVWVGAGSARTCAIADLAGISLNLWGAALEELAEPAEREVTWAGPAPSGPGADERLEALVRGIGATRAGWAIFAWPVAIEVLVRSAKAVRGGR
jgi:alkanesulfonate monooxygenase SsuD/methylene tetrahydromethanopterin reductase-like flavin-dependent oxidoreductase (luciferase family)